MRNASRLSTTAALTERRTAKAWGLYTYPGRRSPRSLKPPGPAEPQVAS